MIIYVLHFKHVYYPHIVQMSIGKLLRNLASVRTNSPSKRHQYIKNVMEHTLVSLSKFRLLNVWVHAVILPKFYPASILHYTVSHYNSVPEEIIAVWSDISDQFD